MTSLRRILIPSETDVSAHLHHTHEIWKTFHEVVLTKYSSLNNILQGSKLYHYKLKLILSYTFVALSYERRSRCYGATSGVDIATKL